MESSTIARKIRANVNQLIQSWAGQVRADPRIKSDAELTQPDLIDHVPAIIDEICQLLEQDEVPSIRNTVEARANVYTRVNQGYRARDLVRELSILRITLIDYVEEIHADRWLGIGSAERQGASRTINLYLDEEMRHAIAVYTDLSAASAEGQSTASREPGTSRDRKDGGPDA